jgi:hypothetical protein
MKSQQSESSLTKQSNIFRLFGFVAAVGCVAVGAGAMAVGLIVPSWDIFKASPKVPTPAKALASTASPSGMSSMSPSATSRQSVELIVRTDTPSPHSDEPTSSPLTRVPTASLQDAESKANNEPLSDANVPTAPPAVVAPQEPPVNPAIGTRLQNSDAPVATSSIAAASPTSSPEAEPKPSTPPRDSHPTRSAQNFAPTVAAHKSRSRGGPTIGQRMWYK